MKQNIKRARKATRQFARENNLRYYNNGVPCSANHDPIIRITKTGGCYHCMRLHQERLQQERDRLKAFQPKYYFQFKFADGHFEIRGPFHRKATAVMKYKRMYLKEYGVKCPTAWFSADDEH